MIFDGHSDLLYDVTRRRLAGESHVLEQHHLDRLRRGGIEGLVLALWYGRGQGQTFWESVPGAERAAHRLEVMLSCAQAEFAECPWLAVVRTAAEAEAARAEGKLYAFLAIEGMEGLERPEELDRLASLGLRLGMLTWNEDNRFAAGAAQGPRQGPDGPGPPGHPADGGPGNAYRRLPPERGRIPGGPAAGPWPGDRLPLQLPRSV